jgi:hypothetical protein
MPEPARHDPQCPPDPGGRHDVVDCCDVLLTRQTTKRLTRGKIPAYDEGLIIFPELRV